MFNLGPGELVTLLLLVVLFFGPMRMPQLAAAVRDRLSARRGQSWSLSEWAQLAAMLALAAIVVTTAVRNTGR